MLGVFDRAAGYVSGSVAMNTFFFAWIPTLKSKVWRLPEKKFPVPFPIGLYRFSVGAKRQYPSRLTGYSDKARLPRTRQPHGAGFSFPGRGRWRAGGGGRESQRHAIVMITRCIAAFASRRRRAAASSQSRHSQNWHRAVSLRAFQRSIADTRLKRRGGGGGDRPCTDCKIFRNLGPWEDGALPRRGPFPAVAARIHTSVRLLQCVYCKPRNESLAREARPQTPRLPTHNHRHPNSRRHHSNHPRRARGSCRPRMT